MEEAPRRGQPAFAGGLAGCLAKIPGDIAVGDPVQRLRPDQVLHDHQVVAVGRDGVARPASPFQLVPVPASGQREAGALTQLGKVSRHGDIARRLGDVLEEGKLIRERSLNLLFRRVLAGRLGRRAVPFLGRDAIDPGESRLAPLCLTRFFVNRAGSVVVIHHAISIFAATVLFGRLVAGEPACQETAALATQPLPSYANIVMRI